jgi:hypothetical protein
MSQRDLPTGWDDPNRSVRIQRLVSALYECGKRPVMEAFIQAAAGAPEDLGKILDSYVSIPPEVYRSIGADELPINRPLVVIDGDAIQSEHRGRKQ